MVQILRSISVVDESEPGEQVYSQRRELENRNQGTAPWRGNWPHQFQPFLSQAVTASAQAEVSPHAHTISENWAEVVAWVCRIALHYPGLSPMSGTFHLDWRLG
jgi:hypothetical protein